MFLKTHLLEHLMKKLLLIPLLGISAYANAVPNFWSYEFSHGFDDFIIENPKKQSLYIHCNSTATEEDDHSVTFMAGRKSYSSTDQGQLSLLLNSNVQVDIPSETVSYRNSLAWDKFRQQLAKAKRIEVFFNNKKLGEFSVNPNSNKNIKSISKDSCEPMIYHSVS